jgi:hypothetical protein
MNKQMKDGHGDGDGDGIRYGRKVTSPWFARTQVAGSGILAEISY